eukprot:4061135-Prymnesium_polylepis.1
MAPIVVHMAHGSAHFDLVCSTSPRPKRAAAHSHINARRDFRICDRHCRRPLSHRCRRHCRHQNPCRRKPCRGCHL